MKFFKIIKTGPEKQILVLTMRKEDLEDIEKLRRALEKETIGEVFAFALQWLRYTLFSILLKGGAVIMKHPQKGEMVIQFSPEEIERIKFDPEEAFRRIVKFNKFLEQLDDISGEDENASN